MLKKIFLIFFLFFFLKGNSQNNQGIAIYSIYQEKSENENNDSDIDPIFAGLDDFAKQYQFTVEFNNKKSYCYSKQKDDLELDSENKLLLFLRKKMLGIDNQYYYSKNNLYESIELSANMYLVVEDSINSKWKLTNESKIIGKYQCYKAIKFIKRKNSSKKFKLEAWYTTSISLPYGPKWFVGLPGLVISAKRGDFVYQLKKLTLNPKKKLKPIIIPKNYKIISKEDFDKLNENLRNNYMKMRG